MGNNHGSQNFLTKNWEVVGPKLMQNVLTHELIAEQLLSFSNSEEQERYTHLLKMRVTQCHPHVVKLIYFQVCRQDFNCQIGKTQYQSRIYTEYLPLTLSQLLAQSQPLAHLSCYCLPILNAVLFLLSNYGPFQLSTNMIYISPKLGGQSKKKAPKIWINSNNYICEPQFPSSQSQMVKNLIQIYSLIKQNSHCGQIRTQKLNRINNLKDLHSQIKSQHHGQRVKTSELTMTSTVPTACNQRYANPNNLKHNPDDKYERSQSAMVKLVQVKDFISVSSITTPNFQDKQKKKDNINNICWKVNQKISSENVKLHHPSKSYTAYQNHTKFANQKPLQNPKINFSYEFSRKQVKNDSITISNDSINPKTIQDSILIQQFPLWKANPRQKTQHPFFSTNIVPLVISQNVSSSASPIVSPSDRKRFSPQRIARQDSKSIQNSSPIVREFGLKNTMKQPSSSLINTTQIQHLPLNKDLQQYKVLKDPLALASKTWRSPEQQKETRQRQEIKKEGNQRQLRKPKSFELSHSQTKGQKGDKYGIFYKYLDKFSQIKKNKLSSSQSASSKYEENYTISGKIKSKQNLQEINEQVRSIGKIKGLDDDFVCGGEAPEAVESLKNGEVREAKSEQSQSCHSQKDLNAKIIWNKEKKQTNIISTRKKIENMRIQDDLYRWMQVIDGEKQELLRSKQKDQYKSIREKVRHKRETFAQLKEEAAKILNDFNF